MLGWSGPQKFMFFLLILLCANYLVLVGADRWLRYESPPLAEGFEGTASGSEKNSDLYTWITDIPAMYDDFYASIYDQLSNQVARTTAKCSLLFTMWKKKALIPPSQWSVLDLGCGTGHASVAMARLGVGRMVGLDISPAMLRYAQKTVVPKAKLTAEQLEALRWRQDTMVNPSAASAAEFSHILCLYFSFYYMKNQEEFFRHCGFWSKPGGKLIVEVVNKYKFDPLLESASPFVGFSLQKYSKERLRKSKVAFDTFEYEGEFTLTDPRGEFYETFRFKDGKVRRQKHEFLMPKIEEVVAMAKRAGWKYVGYQDLNAIGFEYAYLLEFEK